MDRRRLAIAANMLVFFIMLLSQIFRAGGYHRNGILSNPDSESSIAYSFGSGRLDKCSEVWYKCATLEGVLQEPIQYGSNEVIQALDSVLLALIVILLINLLILREQLAVGGVRA